MRLERHRSAVYLAVLTQMGMVHRSKSLVRKQHKNHLQTKRGLIWQCSAGCCPPLLGCMPCVHDKPIAALFCGPLLFCHLLAETTLLVSVDYNSLCPSINLPQQNTTAWFNTEISTKPQPGQCVYLSYISWWQLCQWQHCEMVIMLLSGDRYLNLLLLKTGYYFVYVWILQPGFRTIVGMLKDQPSWYNWQKLRRRYYWGNKQKQGIFITYQCYTCFKI